MRGVGPKGTTTQAKEYILYLHLLLPLAGVAKKCVCVRGENRGALVTFKQPSCVHASPSNTKCALSLLDPSDLSMYVYVCVEREETTKRRGA